MKTVANLQTGLVSIEPLSHDDLLNIETSKPKLPEVKATKRAEIVKDRNDAILGGFPYLGKTIDSDRDSVMAITAAAMAAMAAKSLGLPFNDVWTCADDSTLAVDADKMIGMLIALAQHGSVQHAKARPLKDEVAAETDPEKIKKIKW